MMAALTGSWQRLWRSIFRSGFDVIEHTFIHFINNLQKYKNFNTIFPLNHFFLHFSFLDLSSCVSAFYKSQFVSIPHIIKVFLYLYTEKNRFSYKKQEKNDRSGKKTLREQRKKTHITITEIQT